MSLTYNYYPAVLYAIDLISQGRSRTEACDASNITVATFEKYLASDPQVQMMYIEAERRSYDAMADALLSINLPYDPVTAKPNRYADSNPQMAKVISENIKWVLSKRDIKRFGERIEVKHEITMDRAITGMLDRAKQRAQTGEVIEVEYEETPMKLINGVVNSVVEETEDELLSHLLS